MINDIAIVCTRNRPVLAASTVRSLCTQLAFSKVLVVDASDPPRTAELQELLTEIPNAEMISTTPGLAHQRNVAAKYALADPNIEWLWWFDDDGRVAAGYRETIRRIIGRDGEQRIGGVGGRATDDRPRYSRWVERLRDLVKRAFLLHGPEGAVLASGRHVQVQKPGPSKPVQWLQGGASAYRREVVEALRWDDRLQGYSWGEDLDFSYRAHLSWELVLVPDAEIFNQRTPENRWSARRLGCTRTVLLHAWVREQPGLSLTAFWWSVVGEVIYSLTLAPFDGTGFRRNEVRGVLEGARICLAGRSTREFEYGQ